MKKCMTMLLAVVLLLTACGGEGGETAAKDVDLTKFYDEMAETYQWDTGYMVDVEEDLLESYYPGLSDIPAKQLLAKVPMMSSVVNELVFMECETEDGAKLAAPILQDRIDVQAQGGAFYPESMEAWSRGIVIQQGPFVAMVASAEHQDEITEGFNTLVM